MTRLLQPPQPIRVQEDASGAPQAIEIEGSMQRVETAERWRVSERWWPQPIDREYAKVTGAGWLAVLFRDRISGGWFLERIFD